MTNKEFFIPIKEFEEYYEISNYGRVFSKPRKSWNGKGYKNEGNKILKEKDNGHGYKVINLYKDNKKYCKYIHRLVVEHFIPNVNNYTQINHKDGDKSNNRIENLEWCSGSQNISHRYRVLEKNKRMIKCVETGRIFISCREADIQLGVSLGSVSKVIRGKRDKVKGFTFIKYKGENE